ncbi:MAG: YbjN domain-containing protein [Actinomycetes bacterium]
MEFQTEAHRVGYERCLGLAKEVFGESIIIMDDRPGFAFVSGTTLVTAIVGPWGTDGATLQAYAPVVTGAEMNLELAMFLLNENDDMRYGAFSVHKDGTIYFNYNVVAGTIDKDEFKAAILGVVATADQYDDRIVAKWGGQTIKDGARG